MSETKPEANVVIMGPPGSGKSTQAQLLRSTLGLSYVSVASVLRDEVTRHTAIGSLIADYLIQGPALPIDIVASATLERLSMAKNRAGFVLDGFPRTVQGALVLDGFLVGREWELSAYIILDVPDELAVQRLVQRVNCPECGEVYQMYSAICTQDRQSAICPNCGKELPTKRTEEEQGAARDTASALPAQSLSLLQRRITLYRQYIGPVLEYYERKGLLKVFDASGSTQETFELLATSLPDLQKLLRRA
jgi:adenylate kinase